MVRRVALLAVGLVAALLPLLVSSPAGADSSDASLAGAFTGSLRMTDTWIRGGWGAQPGERTYIFGKGCAAGSACRLLREDGSATTLAAAPGGSFTWSGTQPVGCIDEETGVEQTKHGFDYAWKVVLRPVATTVVDGVRYVTALGGTYVGTLAVNATGRRFDCLVDPMRVPAATERGTFALRLAPLAAPAKVTTSPPLGLVGRPSKGGGGSGRSGDSSATTAEGVTEGTVPGFTLPLTGRQRESAVAVAAGLRSSVPGALVTPREALRTARDRLPRDLLWVALLGLLMVFPAQLFNSTYEENHERVDRQLARLRPVRRRAASTPAPPVLEQAGRHDEPPDAPPAAPDRPPRARRLLVFGACAVAGTLLGGLLDPDLGTTRASYALLTGIFSSVVLTVLLVALTGGLFRMAARHEHGWYLRAIPSALLVAVVCVVVSRATHFEPGYLYGVVGGAVFALALDVRSEGRAEVAVGLVTIVVALGAWIAFEPVARAATGSDPSFLTLTGDALLASLFIGSLEGLLFGLVPLRFLPGARIAGWSWLAWGVLAALVLYVFVHALLLPESGYLGRSTSASATVTVALFLAFGVVSVAFWSYFKLRPTPEPAPDSLDPEALVGSEGEPGPDLRPSEPVAGAQVPAVATGDTVAAPRVPRQPGRSDRES